MSHIPTLNKSDIMRWVGSASFGRAQVYVRDGSIVNPRCTALVLKAHCHDAITPAHRVEVTLDEQGIVKGDCSCPMGGAGRCKHVGALLLTWLEEPDAFREVESLARSLEWRSKEELILFARQMVAHHPHLETRLEVPRLNRYKKGLLEADVIRQHVAKALQSVDQSEWGASSWIAAELSHVVRLGDQYLRVKELDNATMVYKVVSHDLLDDYQKLDDKEGQLYAIIKKCVFGLGSCLAGLDESQRRENIFHTLFKIYEWEVKELSLNHKYQEVTDIIVALGRPEEKQLFASWVRELCATNTGWPRYTFSRFLLILEGHKLDDEPLRPYHKPFGWRIP